MPRWSSSSIYDALPHYFDGRLLHRCLELSNIAIYCNNNTNTSHVPWCDSTISIVSTTHPIISLCHSVRCHRFVTIRVWTMQSLIIVDAYVLMYCSMENTCFHPPTLPLWFCCAIHPPTYNLTHIICASRMLLWWSPSIIILRLLHPILFVELR